MAAHRGRLGEPNRRARMFEWIVETVEAWGYLGVFLLMLAENLFPPIPSELIMPLAGFVAARGDLSFTGVMIAGLLGTMAGALPWYYAGKLFGAARVKALAARFGRVMTVEPRDVDYAVSWFDRHGVKAVLFGRLVPTVRTLISVPAGIVRMNFGTFMLYSTIGSAAWIGLLTGAGYVLNANYTRVAEYIDPVSKIVVALVVLVYLYRFFTWKRSSDGKAP
jgi:membrane protein DedA with SNARE-associated domain